MKRFIKLIICSAIACVMQGCLDGINDFLERQMDKSFAKANKRLLYMYADLYIENGTQQDIAIEYRLGCKPQAGIVDTGLPTRGWFCDIAKGQTTTNPIASTMCYDAGRPTMSYDSLLRHSNYVIDFFTKSKPNYTPFKVPELPISISNNLAVVAIYNNGTNVRTWTYYDISDRSPFTPYDWRKNWRCVVKKKEISEKYRTSNCWLDCTYTIKDEDLIPEEGVEE